MIDAQLDLIARLHEENCDLRKRVAELLVERKLIMDEVQQVIECSQRLRMRLAEVQLEVELDPVEATQ